jgi:hypothetical protein
MTAVTLLNVRTVATRSVVESAPHADTLYVAVVHAPDGVPFATAAPSRAAIVRQLAEYVRSRVNYALWADDARHVRSLLLRRELEAAVEVYFGRVGDRWDAEWLVTAAVVKASGEPNVGGVHPIVDATRWAERCVPVASADGSIGAGALTLKSDRPRDRTPTPEAASAAGVRPRR